MIIICVQHATPEKELSAPILLFLSHLTLIVLQNIFNYSI